MNAMAKSDEVGRWHGIAKAKICQLIRECKTQNARYKILQPAWVIPQSGQTAVDAELNMASHIIAMRVVKQWPEMNQEVTGWVIFQQPRGRE